MAELSERPTRVGHAVPADCQPGGTLHELVADVRDDCPFCGSVETSIEGQPSTGWAWVVCSLCNAVGPDRPSRGEAVAAWNARAGDPGDDMTEAEYYNEGPEDFPEDHDRSDYGPLPRED